MSAKELQFSAEARERLLAGVNILSNAVKAGDRILFGKWSGTEVKIDGQDMLIMKESDILGIIEEDKAAAAA